ncbi:MAG: hypothetical protein JRC90_04530 [Deltaproteobacteria bacterium]|nr:hypothetical protein [Deltaproteobacteria bacterium]
MTEQTDIPLRTVAFLDILGFRAKLFNTPLLELAHGYEKRIRESHFMNRPFDPTGQTPTLFKDHPSNLPWCSQHVFSDSIILVSHDKDIMSCMKLLVYAWRLSQHFMAFGTPLRGGIAYGELYQNPNLNVFVGKALAKAYELEGCQNWIGVAIDASVVERFPEVFGVIDKDEYPVLNDLLFEYAVPFKGGMTKRLKTLNWRWNLVVEKGTRSLFSDSNDPKVVEKVNNTLKYVEAFVQKGRLYVKDQSKLPVELRSFYIGAKEPPFEHGDDL